MVALRLRGDRVKKRVSRSWSYLAVLLVSINKKFALSVVDGVIKHGTFNTQLLDQMLFLTAEYAVEM